MTGANVIRALSDDLEVPPSKVEDILVALHDLMIETILKGERFNLGEIGAMFAGMAAKNGHKNGAGFPRAVIRFEASPETRKRLNVPELKFPTAETEERLLCPECKMREKQISKACSTCLRNGRKAKRGIVVKPRNKTWKRKLTTKSTK